MLLLMLYEALHALTLSHISATSLAVAWMGGKRSHRLNENKGRSFILESIADDMVPDDLPGSTKMTS